jgi:hypothetical protein
MTELELKLNNLYSLSLLKKCFFLSFPSETVSTVFIHICISGSLVFISYSIYFFLYNAFLTPPPKCFVFLSFFFFKDLFIYFMKVHCNCLETLQKRAPNLVMDGCEPPCGCWDLNSGPSEE